MINIKTRLKKAIKTRDFKNISYSFLSYLILPVITIISTPLLIANLGLANYGYWILINSVIGILGITNFGLGNTIVKYGSKYIADRNENEFQKLISFGLFISCIIALIVTASTFYLGKSLAIFLTAGSQEFPEVVISLFQLTGLVISIKIVGGIFSAIILSYQRYDVVSKINIIVNFISTLVITFLAIYTNEIKNLIYVLVLSNILALVIFYFYAKKKHSIIKLDLRIEKNLFKEWGAYSLYAWLQVIISAVYTQFDKILVSSLLGPQALGIYSACLQLAVKIHELFTSASGYLFPKFSDFYEKSQNDKLVKTYYNATILLSIGVLSIGLPLFVFAEFILSVWINPEFGFENYKLLQYLTIASVAGTYFIIPFHLLNAIGKIKLNTNINFILALINFLGSLFLIPYFELIGASFGRLLGFPVIMISIFYIEKKIMNISTSIKYTLPIFLLSTSIIITWITFSKFKSPLQDFYITFFFVITILALVYYISVNIMKKINQQIS